MSDPIVIERLIAAPPSVVYSYLTSSEKWARWQGVDAVVQPMDGGELSIVMPDGTSARGEILELEPDRRVVFTWGWVDHPEVPPGSTTVEIDLVGEEGGTRLRLTHRGLPPNEVQIHTAGWEHYTSRLGDVSEGRDPGPDIPAS